jgi:hypothetical protein
MEMDPRECGDPRGRLIGALAIFYLENIIIRFVVKVLCLMKQKSTALAFNH